MNDPVLILADEPTGALDTRTSFEVMGLLQQLNRSGLTVVVVTHEHDIAAFASRLIAFRDGLIVDDRPNPRPADATLFAASIIYGSGHVSMTWLARYRVSRYGLCG